MNTVENKKDNTNFESFQLQFIKLGRNKLTPWLVIKQDGKIPLAYDCSKDDLYKLESRPAREGEDGWGKEDNRARWENGCLKLHFGKRFANGFGQLTRLASRGHELFVIPNYIPLDPEGENGIGADFITFAPVVFAEIDDIPIREQWKKIQQLEQEFGLAPTMVVYSGGKSLHIYFQFHAPLTDIEKWKRLQRKLICILNSDPAIANPNREMRMAGVVRKSKGTNQSLQLERDISYDSDEYEEISDSTGKFPYNLDADRFRRWRREGDVVLRMTPEELNPPRDKHPQRDERTYQVDRFGDAAPLEHFVTRHDQELINSGASSERNNQGFFLAKNLIATEERLSQLGIPYAGNAYNLFIDYCHACASGGGWDQHEWEQVWRSADRSKKFHSVPDDGLQKRAFFYQLGQSGGFSKGETQWEEPDSEAYEQHEKEQQEEAAREEAERERDRERWRENYPIAAKNKYRREKQFTTENRITKPYLALEDIPLRGNAIIGIKSALGTGKTEVIKEMIHAISTKPSLFGEEETNPEGWLAIGHRNNLLIQSCERWGFIHLKSAEAEGQSVQALISDNTSKIACCYDSLIKFKPEDFNGRNIILDETTAGILHLLTGKTEVKRRLEETCSLFEEALKRANRVICLDGLLTDSAIAYLHKLAPNKGVYKLQNDYTNPAEITHFLGTEEEVEGEITIRKNNRAPLVKMMLSAERPVVCSDSQIFCSAMETIFQKEGMQGIRIDGETSGEEWAKEVLKDPDGYMKAHQLQYLIYSPSMESGNSIDIRGYFDEQYAFFFGAIGTDAQHQMMFRVRDPDLQRHFWCKEFDSNAEQLRSPFPRQNLKNHQALLLQDMIDCHGEGEDVSEKFKAFCEMTQKNPHHEMWGKLEAIHCHEKGNLRECLVDSLKDAGHKLIDLSLEDLTNDKLESNAKDETKDRYANDIYTAEDIDTEDIEERKQRGKWKDQCAVKKKLLKLQLPDIDSSPYWNPETIRLLKYDERDRLQKLERYWMIQNLDGAKQLQRQRWEKLAEGKIHRFHFKSDYSKILALIDAGIEQFMDSTKEWKADDPEVQEFLANCKKYEFKVAFGRSPSKKTYPMRWIGTCLDFFGFQWRDRQRKVEGKNIRVYRSITPLKGDMKNPTFYNCISERLNKALESKNSEKTPPTPSNSGVDGVAEVPTEFKTTSTSATPEVEKPLVQGNCPKTPVTSGVEGVAEGPTGFKTTSTSATPEVEKPLAQENCSENPSTSEVEGVAEVHSGFKPTSPSGTSQSDHIPTALDHSPNRDRDDVLSKDKLTPKVISILERDGERLDWDIAKELDQPSASIEEVLSEVGDISCKRMFGNVYRLKPEFLDTA